MIRELMKKQVYNNILIIPDVHGRSFWKDPVKNEVENVDRIIFLGDYIDPYPSEGISSKEAIGILEEIIDLKKNNPLKVVLLLGNHDVHYFLSVLKSDRYDSSNSIKIERIYKENLELFQLFFKEGKYLFSHAGIMKEWMEKYCGCDNINQLLGDESKAYSSLSVIPLIRGGWEDFGSCVWNDVRDFKNDIPKTFQIFGHTQLAKEYIMYDFACLDCRKCFILDIEEQLLNAYGSRSL